jgi:uncharacterized surface protein with fasciclin (FAS1) repeats
MLCLARGSSAHAADTVAGDLAERKDLGTFTSFADKTGALRMLGGRGAVTVFAPTNAAFARLPPLVQVAMPHDPHLRRTIDYAVVRGTYPVESIRALIRKGGGKTTLPTVNGEILTFEYFHGRLQIVDARHDLAFVVGPDMRAGNGIVHTIDTVLLP